VFDVKPDGTGLELIELADGVTLEDVAAKTEATYTISENLKSLA
jgi:3-oxoacid CoA-transferase subunit B